MGKSSLSQNERSSSETNEKGQLADVVRSIPPFLSLFTHNVLKDLVATDIQALGPDVIEATEYAKRMSREEIEEVIDHILENVGSLSASHKTYPSPRRFFFFIARQGSKLSSSCARDGQNVQVRRDPQGRSSSVPEGLRGA